MSEKEVQIVARFLNSHQQKLVGYLDVHSYSQLWLIPWGYAKEKVKDYDELVSVQTNVLCKGAFFGDQVPYILSGSFTRHLGSA